ncbi:MAG: putative lipid II flippase FtsW [Actinobacteria bacterium]|nr:putative lipid II flippase FtsW [Actinomycetota bacterium]
MAQASNALKNNVPENRARPKAKPAKPSSSKGTKKAPQKKTASRNSRTARAVPSKRKSGKTARKSSAGRPAAAARQTAGTARKNTGGKSAKRVSFAFATSARAYLVLIPTVALLLLGLVMVFSAGQVIGIEQGVGGYRYFTFQLIWASLGLVAMIFFAKFDYHKLGKLSVVGMVVSIGLLVLVLLIGINVYGAKRWIPIGPFTLQPTEIGKFALIIFSAYALAHKGKRIEKFAHLMVPVILAMAIVCGLFMLQPDLGSSIVIGTAVFMLLAIAGANLWHLAVVGSAAGAAAVVLAIIEPYRMQRILAFMNPEKFQQGASYQLMQSFIALGSGNIKGLGLGMSKQKFMYIPNAHNDFIFSIIGEELGLIGTLSVVALVGLLMYGGYRIAKGAPDQLGKLLATGIVGLIVVQALVNMGGVTGLMPITGVPLPLVSFGGSSLCICMGCIGILLNVAEQSGTHTRGLR